LCLHAVAAIIKIMAERQLVVFSLAEEFCALDLASVREILPTAELSAPPGMPELLAGFLNLGGTAVPVLRLGRLFQFPAKEIGLYEHLILLRARRPLALLVDRVDEVRTCSEDALRPVGDKNSFNDCTQSQLTHKDRTIHVLSVDRLLLKEEEARLSELRDLEQKRLRALAVT
jgi:purine-binding chemotaxis protein CheW